jgi:hypothetical protein
MRHGQETILRLRFTYNDSVLNFYNAKGYLARFENKNILFLFEKCSAYYNAGVVAVN